MSTSSSVIELNEQSSTALRIIIPVIYIILAIFGVIGNLIVLQIICANRFRHKSIHLLVLSILFADLFFIIIFTIVRTVSYAYLNTTWFINPNDWCKAEMYLLRLFDFVLAYSIVFMCLDRAVKMGSCWFGIRKFRSGISIVISVWIASAYVLIPILLFKQTIFTQSYGGYLCYSTDESVPLFWLGNFPRRILDFIDIVFRTLFPVFLMIILLIIASINSCRTNKNKVILNNNNYGIRTNDHYSSSTSLAQNSKIVLENNFVKDDLSLFSNNYNQRLFSMVFSYVVLFIICQLPYEIYRCVLLWDMEMEKNLWIQKIDFAIEIPLLILKLINRCVNPFFFMCLADIYGLRGKCCRLWCIPCLPGCIGCKQCWCYDCGKTLCYEVNHCFGSNSSTADNFVPTGLQTISTYQYRDGDRLVTKQKIIEEYETGVEPFYKNPKLRERYEESGAFVNDTFENDDHFRASTVRINQPNQNDNLRIKL